MHSFNLTENHSILQELTNNLFGTAHEAFLLIIMSITYCLGGALILSLWKKHSVKTYNVFFMVSLLAKLPIVFSIFENVGTFSTVIMFLFLVQFLILTYRSLKVYFTKNGLRCLVKSFFRTYIVLGIAFKFVYMKMIWTVMRMGLCLGWKLLYSPADVLDKIRSFLPCFCIHHFYIYFAVIGFKVIRNLFCLATPKRGLEHGDNASNNKYSVGTCTLCNSSADSPDDVKITLKCSHTYHEECLVAWSIICENCYCYLCKEKIERKILNQNRCMKWAMWISQILQFGKINLIIASTLPFMIFPVIYIKNRYMQ